ncbi:MAG: repeat domain protein [Labilithrix sp.]|nr:repeat domain protein [Labilithrix sp.]
MRSGGALVRIGYAAAAFVALAGTASCGAGHGGGPDAPATIVVGSVGDGGARPAADRDSAAKDAPPAVELALAEGRACVRANGKVHCTNEVSEGRPLSTAAAIEGIEDAVSLSIRNDGGCAVTAGGKVLCFGDNQFGQLGAGLVDDHSDRAVPVIGVTHAVRVEVSETHACALLEGGALACWGRNDEGQTGSDTAYADTARELATAVTLPQPRGVVSLGLTGDATCAATSSGTTWCFGRAHVGPEAAPGARGSNLIPQAVAPLAGYVEIASSSSGASCGIRGGRVACWGDTFSLLVNRRFGATNVTDAGIVSARHVRLGSAHACALLETGEVSCWGASYSGGPDPGTSEPPAPQLVAGVSGVRELVVGGTMSCALAKAGAIEAKCWGHFPRGTAAPPAQEEDPDPYYHYAPVTVRLTR